jgi:hypothetical protein
MCLESGTVRGQICLGHGVVRGHSQAYPHSLNPLPFFFFFFFLVILGFELRACTISHSASLFL